MSYPAKPRQLSLDQQVEQGAVVPVAPETPATVPQVVGGAPKLNTIGSGLLDGINFDRRLTPAVGSGGPERWDTLRRDAFSGDNLRYTTTMTPSKEGPQQILQTYPDAVSSLRDKLEARRKQLSPTEIAKSPFWKEYESGGQAFVADLIARVQARLTRAQRFQQERENVRQLSAPQQDWIRNHPLSMWMDWI